MKKILLIISALLLVSVAIYVDNMRLRHARGEARCYEYASNGYGNYGCEDCYWKSTNVDGTSKTWSCPDMGWDEWTYLDHMKQYLYWEPVFWLYDHGYMSRETYERKTL